MYLICSFMFLNSIPLTSPSRPGTFSYNSVTEPHFLFRSLANPSKPARGKSNSNAQQSSNSNQSSRSWSPLFKPCSFQGVDSLHLFGNWWSRSWNSGFEWYSRPKKTWVIIAPNRHWQEAAAHQIIWTLEEHTVNLCGLHRHKFWIPWNMLSIWQLIRVRNIRLFDDNIMAISDPLGDIQCHQPDFDYAIFGSLSKYKGINEWTCLEIVLIE